MRLTYITTNVMLISPEIIFCKKKKSASNDIHSATVMSHRLADVAQDLMG